jgi:iron-sulfur cluster assembly accessory protein
MRCNKLGTAEMRNVLLMFTGYVLLGSGCNSKTSVQDIPASTPHKLKEVVKFTPQALAKLREVQSKDGKPYLRVLVKSGGSTGYMYDMKMDDQYDPKSDFLNEQESIKIIVDMRSSLYLDGTTIDWQTTPDGRQGFKFDNPNAVKEPANSPPN